MNKCIKIKPDIKELSLYWFVREMVSLKYDKETIYKASLVLEELLVNIISNSKTTKPVMLNIQYTPNEIKIRMADEGIKFNPLENCKANESINDMEFQKTDNLGIFIINSIAEKVIYKRIGRFNIISLGIKASREQGRSITNKGKGIISRTISLFKNNNIYSIAY